MGIAMLLESIASAMPEQALVGARSSALTAGDLLALAGGGATVLRDAFAQAWQVTADCCLGCTQQCREAGRLDSVGPCVTQQEVIRYGDASPDLMYCAEALLDDSRRFVARATAAGAHVSYIEHPDVVHMWMVMAPDLPESCQAFDAAAQFLSDLL